MGSKETLIKKEQEHPDCAASHEADLDHGFLAASALRNH